MKIKLGVRNLFQQSALKSATPDLKREIHGPSCRGIVGGEEGGGGGVKNNGGSLAEPSVPNKGINPNRGKKRLSSKGGDPLGVDLTCQTFKGRDRSKKGTAGKIIGKRRGTGRNLVGSPGFWGKGVGAIGCSGRRF